ncbi:MAG: hypothetical protein JW764_10480 [Chlorobiaceae bacterium]|nr:hypothetical protein [Chlorobiaceae bacterium]
MDNQHRNPSSHQKRRHYIVVVHGMGEQKTNVTAPAVVERFAEARQRTADWKASDSPDYGFIIPANLSEQTVRYAGIGRGWAEFEGIPVLKECADKEFNGSICTDPEGKNFRFVDIEWQFILRSDIENFGSSTEEWSSALLEKLRLRKQKEACLQKSRPETVNPMPVWALPMLESIVNTAIPIKKMLAFKYAGLTRLVFDGFLGDVHLYGDYRRTRGRAVRHFHVVLDEIMIRDFTKWYHRVYLQNPAQPYQPPEFTIIAHSLGSIMSFDALVYAHAKDEIRKTEDTSKAWPTSLPFPGYCNVVNDNETKNWNHLYRKLYEIWTAEKNNTQILDVIRQLVPDADKLFSTRAHQQNNQTVENNDFSAPDIPYISWKNHVTNFITIGSPVDKFLALWPDNYNHLNDNCTTNIKEEDCLFIKGRINHYNFCDEQDPVGHHLEEAMKTPLYKTVFQAEPPGNHDVVFRRYGVPGFAHNMYWTDQQLFFGIIDNIIDTKKADDNNRFVWKDIHEKKLAFKSAKRWAYYLIPFLTVLVTTALFSYGMMNGSLLWRWIYIIASVLLWVQPNALSAYKKELVSSRKIDDSWFAWIADKWNKIRLVRGIFSRLVSAAIEWRRILIVESLGSNTTYDVHKRIAFQRQEMSETSLTHNEPLKYFIQLLIISFVCLVISAYFFMISDAGILFLNIFSDHQEKSPVLLKAGRIAFFFMLTYTFVRFYVAFSFFRAWKRIHPQKSNKPET